MHAPLDSGQPTRGSDQGAAKAAGKLQPPADRHVWHHGQVSSFPFSIYIQDAFIQSDLHPCMHTFTHRRWSQPHRATASSSGAGRLRCPAQGHLNTRMEEPEIKLETFRLPVDPLHLLSYCRHSQLARLIFGLKTSEALCGLVAHPVVHQPHKQ